MMLRCLLLLCCLSGVLPAQKLVIGGDVPTPLTLSAAEIAAMPHVSVKVDDHGKSVPYEGVLLYDLLKKAGAPLGKDLSGKALASYVLGSAQDGYQVVYTLTELDPEYVGTQIIVADQSDGKPLAEKVGPLRIVVPGEKKMARSLRMLERIDVHLLRK